MESSVIKHLALKLDSTSFLPEAIAPTTKLHHKKYSTFLNYKDMYQNLLSASSLICNRKKTYGGGGVGRVKKNQSSLMDKHPFGTRLKLFNGILCRTDSKAHLTVPIPQELEN